MHEGEEKGKRTAGKKRRKKKERKSPHKCAKKKEWSSLPGRNYNSPAMIGPRKEGKDLWGKEKTHGCSLRK